MTASFPKGNNGYEIPCLHNFTGRESALCIVSHGMGSSKESPTAALLAEELEKHGVGTVAFDFPGHGGSPVDGRMLTVENCISDLASVEAWAREQLPWAPVFYFASSFGAFIDLLYLSREPHAGARAFLRSTAVEMGRILRQRTPQELASLEQYGQVTLDMAGYCRPLILTAALFRELDALNLFQLYRPGTASLAMVHGSGDEVAPLEDARRFAQYAGAALTVIPGGTHSLSGPGMAQAVARLAADFFSCPQCR